MRLILCILAVIAATTSAPLAGEKPLRALLSGADNRGWEGVGRLEMGQSIFCTGALIAPDLVITAAHCLFNNQSGKMFTPNQMTFQAGWRNGRANATRGVRIALPHPDFDFTHSDKVVRVANDLALVLLDKPILKPSVRPFGIAEKPRKWDEVGVISYARNRADSPSIQEVCQVLARQSGTLVLTCDVDFGSSGAPVFTLDESGLPKIVSIISAKAETAGRKVALGTDFLRPLSDLVSLMADNRDTSFTSAPTKPRVRKNPTDQRKYGAKFLRP